MSATRAARSATDAATVVRDFLAHLEAFDVDAAIALVDPAIVYHNKGLPAIRGVDAFERAMRSMSRWGSAFEAQLHRIVADGGTVLTERTDVIQVGPVRAAFWVCGTFEVRDGRITLWRDYFDFVNVTGALVTGLLRAVLPRR